MEDFGPAQASAAVSGAGRSALAVLNRVGGAGFNNGLEAVLAALKRKSAVDREGPARASPASASAHRSAPGRAARAAAHTAALSTYAFTLQ